MLGFNPNTQPVVMKEWVTPLDPSIYAQGVANQAKRLEAQSAEDSELYNSFMNIQAIAPQDEEQLQKLKQSFEKELSGLTMGDLRNPQTKAQLSQIQNKYTNLLLESGIPQRTSSFKQELAAKKDAEAKGKQYVSPLLRQAEKYIQDGNFYKDTRFNQQGFVAPDNKELDEIAKNTPEWENWVTQGNYDVHQKGKAESSLFNNYLTHFTNNPQWSALLNDQFEQQIENLDLNEIVSQGLNGIEQLFPNLPPEKQQEALNDLQQGLAMQQSNPYLQSAVKDKLRNDYFRNQAYMAAQAKTYVNTVDKKQNAYAKDAIDFQQAKELELFKHKLDLGEIPGVKGKLSELDKTIYQAVVASGKPIYDSNGNLIPVSALASENNLSYNPQESRDGKSGTKTVTTPETKILIGAKEYKVADAEANIIAGSKEFIKEALESYYEPLEKDEDIEINGDDIYYEKKGISGSNSTGWDKHITKQQLINKIKGSQPSSNKPNSTNYVKKAQLGDGTLVYSNDGNTYYDDKGNEYDNQGNKK